MVLNPRSALSFQLHGMARVTFFRADAAMSVADRRIVAALPLAD
jgi:hypothetical protein